MQVHWRSQRGARGGTCPPWLLKFSKIISVKQSLTDMEEKKKKKNGTSTWEWLWHRNEKGKKKVLTYQIMLLSFPTWNLHLFHYFLFYIIIYTIFTIYDTFQSILSLNDARNTTNFTSYVLQIGISPITKNNFKNLFIIFFK